MCLSCEVISPSPTRIPTTREKIAGRRTRPYTPFGVYNWSAR